jgi:hypothetical protein
MSNAPFCLVHFSNSSNRIFARTIQCTLPTIIAKSTPTSDIFLLRDFDFVAEAKAV